MLKRYLYTFYRHKWLFLTAAVVMLTATAVAAQILSRGYESSARIWVDRPTLNRALDESPFSSYSTPAEEFGDMLFELLQTDWFMVKVLSHTTSEVRLTESTADDEQLAEAIRANLWNRATGPNTIEIVYLSDDAVFSQQVVAGIVEEFRVWVFGIRLEQSAAALEYYQGQVGIYEEQTAAARERLDVFLVEHPDSTPNSPEFMELQRLQREFEAARNLQTAALIQLSQAGAENSLSTTYSPAEFRILDAPTVPRLPVATMTRQLKWIAPGVGATIALVLGSIVLMTWQDQAIRSDDELETLTGLQVLCVMPNFTSRRRPDIEQKRQLPRIWSGLRGQSAENPAD